MSPACLSLYLALVCLYFLIGQFTLTTLEIIMIRCAIWYHLYNLKNVKNIDGGVLLLVKLKTSNFTKSNTLPSVFSRFLKLYKWYQIVQNITCNFVLSTMESNLNRIFFLQDETSLRFSCL